MSTGFLTTLACLSVLPIAGLAYGLGCDAGYLGAHGPHPGEFDAFEVTWWIAACVCLAIVPAILMSIARHGRPLRLRDRGVRTRGILITLAMIAIYGFGAFDAEEAWTALVRDRYPPDHEGPYRFLFSDVQHLHHVSWTWVILTTLAAVTFVLTIPQRDPA